MLAQRACRPSCECSFPLAHLSSLLNNQIPLLASVVLPVLYVCFLFHDTFPGDQARISLTSSGSQSTQNPISPSEDLFPQCPHPGSLQGCSKTSHPGPGTRLGTMDGGRVSSPLSCKFPHVQGGCLALGRCLTGFGNGLYTYTSSQWLIFIIQESVSTSHPTLALHTRRHHCTLVQGCATGWRFLPGSRELSRSPCTCTSLGDEWGHAHAVR